MITDAMIEEVQLKHGYDWHNAYFACLIKRAAETYTTALSAAKSRSGIDKDDRAAIAAIGGVDG